MQKTVMKLAGLATVVLAVLSLNHLASSQTEPSQTEPTEAGPSVSAADPIQAGRYLAVVGGCNDCHTEGYLLSDGQVPEELWLGGNNMGFSGPWGTSYPSNLRDYVQRVTEQGWLVRLRAGGRPPMPWFNLALASEQDLRALYQYIRSLGPLEHAVRAPLPPGEQAEPPYFLVVLPEGAGPPAGGEAPAEGQ